jgi:hypothetical protein
MKFLESKITNPHHALRHGTTITDIVSLFFFFFFFGEKDIVSLLLRGTTSTKHFPKKVSKRNYSKQFNVKAMQNKHFQHNRRLPGSTIVSLLA